MADTSAEFNQGLVLGLAMQPLTAATVTPSNNPLTDYEYISDNSVRYNGVTYTVEKDSTTGLISKITDNFGTSFSPVANSKIADPTLHNAVFWATAMCRGLGRKIYGNKNIFEFSNVADGIWINTGDGYNITLPEGAELTTDGVSLKTGNYHLPITGTLGDYTVFVVAKKRTDHTSSSWTTTIANYVAVPQFNICTRDLYWSVGAGGAPGVYAGSISSSNFAVVSMRKSGNVGDFYVNKIKLNTYTGYASPIHGYWDIGKEFWFKYIAIIPEVMSDSEIAAEIDGLMSKYNI